MKTRTARFTWLLRCAAMTIVLLQAACDESTSTATSSETPATSADSSGRPDATFQTPEALVSHLRALRCEVLSTESVCGSRATGAARLPCCKQRMDIAAVETPDMPCAT